MSIKSEYLSHTKIKIPYYFIQIMELRQDNDGKTNEKIIGN